MKKEKGVLHTKRRDPRHDPEVGDVIRDPDGFYIYVQGRSARLVFAQPFGDKKPGLWCTNFKLGYWRRKAKECEVIIVSPNRVF